MNISSNTKGTSVDTGIPESVTQKVAGQLLHCSTQTVNRYIKDGKLRGYRISAKKILVDLSDIKAMFSSENGEAKQ